HTAPPQLSPLSLHDALPISTRSPAAAARTMSGSGSYTPLPAVPPIVTAAVAAVHRSTCAGEAAPVGHERGRGGTDVADGQHVGEDRKSTRLNSSHDQMSYAG